MSHVLNRIDLCAKRRRAALDVSPITRLMKTPFSFRMRTPRLHLYAYNVLDERIMRWTSCAEDKCSCPYPLVFAAGFSDSRLLTGLGRRLRVPATRTRLVLLSATPLPTRSTRNNTSFNLPDALDALCPGRGDIPCLFRRGKLLTSQTSSRKRAYPGRYGDFWKYLRRRAISARWIFLFYTLSVSTS
ncbi:hypothetical protein EXIGLDRAFT_462832 [Exidia glandulosa HHB12029]|uniref:Uncharacterized protein n=1 Tax=Exidia glandulosa HHB12029 TaxID=1314781 RepID=A0A166AWD4_EXIGL|nr:hypothetical protein EXIGLDRAFT_462832 [Exidia glandulosa HHB12029]